MERSPLSTRLSEYALEKARKRHTFFSCDNHRGNLNRLITAGYSVAIFSYRFTNIVTDFPIMYQYYRLINLDINSAF